MSDFDRWATAAGGWFAWYALIVALGFMIPFVALQAVLVTCAAYQAAREWQGGRRRGRARAGETETGTEGGGP